MKAFTLQEAAAALGLPQMQAQATLADVCTDTRKIQPGSLFVCLRGERFDGHSFASQAAKLGAAALLVDHPVDADVPQLVVRIPARRCSSWPVGIVGGFSCRWWV